MTVFHANHDRRSQELLDLLVSGVGADRLLLLSEVGEA
jgi:hypothetical protein